VDTRPSQVDTRGSSQRTLSTGLYSRSTLDAIVSTLEGFPRRHVLRIVYSVSTLDQVDILRKLYDLKSHLDTSHSRDLVDRPWIMCPRPPRVLLDILGYKYTPNWPSNQESLQEPSINPLWRQREISSLFLLPLCSFTPIRTSLSTRREV
ncbi:hypothetical protein Taro_036865, partial [Colocasia esculenta]|nr:hypothetical protein [Colocasia esculenta]